jgi:DNA repair protein RadC
MHALDILDLPRERFIAHGGDRVTTAELLALILGTGTRGRSAIAVAQQLIYAVGGIAQLARATPRELVGIPGIGAARAARVAAAFHLSRRAMEAGCADTSAIHGPADLHERLRIRMSGMPQEVFLVVALDARNVVFDYIEVARGCLTSVEVHPREVFRPLIRQAAATAVVAHNHPSGDPTPSQEDIALTYRLHEVGMLIGIPILDHIIVGARSCTSIYGHLGLA